MQISLTVCAALTITSGLMAISFRMMSRAKYWWSATVATFLSNEWYQDFVIRIE